MSDSEFWTQANQPRQWPGRGPVVARPIPQVAQPAPPDVTAAEPVDYLMGMSMDEYAASRTSMPVANDFGLVRENTSGFPDAADLKGSATALAALTNPYRVHERPGHAPRERGVDAAALPTSIAGIPCRGTN